MEVFITIRTYSPNDYMGWHWTKRSKLAKLQKLVVASKRDQIKQPLPVEVTLVRQAPRALDDDNLRGALKWVRDQVADILIPGKQAGRADDDPRIKFYYRQQKGPVGVWIQVVPHG